MLPGSVEARAKMKMTRGQLAALPFSSSLRIDESWRASSWAASWAGAAGRAAARPAAARSLRNFIVAEVRGGVKFLV